MTCLAMMLAGTGAVAQTDPVNQAFVLFDGMCVGTSARLATVEKMVLASGAKPIPQNAVDQDAAVAQHGGKGFIGKRGDVKYALIVTTIGSCAVMAQGLDPKKMQAVLVKNYPLAQRHVESAGAQVNTLYQFTAPSASEGDYVMFGVPKPGMGADGAIVLSFITEAGAAKIGLPTAAGDKTKP